MDSLDGMPEFTKPSESEPIVIIPDQAKPEKPRCQSTKKDGVTPCNVPPLRGEKYCLGHSKSLAPELREKWRKLAVGVPKTERTTRRNLSHYTKDDLLGFLSKRLDLVKDKFGDMCSTEVEEMICNIVRTMALVHKLEEAAADDEKSAGWRMKGAV